jgi:hypothetical protein
MRKAIVFLALSFAVVNTHMKSINEIAVDAVREFLNRINQHDVDKLVEYMIEVSGP